MGTDKNIKLHIVTDIKRKKFTHQGLLSRLMDENNPKKSLVDSKGSSSFITWCDICNVKLNNPNASTQHLNGRLHKSKVNASKGNALKRNSDNANGGTKGITEETPSKKSKTNEKEGSVSSPIVAEVSDSDLKCDVCNKVFTTSLSALQHFKGKQHTAKVEMEYKKKNEEKRVSKCEECDLEFQTDLVALQHFKGKKHAAKLESIAKGKRNMEKPSQELQCEICDKIFHCEATALQHFQGKKHAANVLKSTEDSKQITKDVKQLNGQLHNPNKIVARPSDKPPPAEASKEKSEIAEGSLNKKNQKKPLTCESVAGETKTGDEVSESDLKCEFCDQTFQTGINALQHFKGRKHALKVKASEQKPEKLSCEDCKKEFSTEVQAVQHFKGEKHAKKVTSNVVRAKEESRKAGSARGRGGGVGGRGSGSGRGSFGRGGNMNTSKGNDDYNISKVKYDYKSSLPYSYNRYSNPNNFNSSFKYATSNTSDPASALLSVSSDIMHLKRMLWQYEH